MNGADIALTWGEVFSILGLIVTVISAGGGLTFMLYRQIRAVKTDLDAHKLEVATKYVQSEHLTQMKEDLIRTETRTLSAIQGLSERFDRFLTRQDQ